MKDRKLSGLTGILLLSLIAIPAECYCQSNARVIEKYLTGLVLAEPPDDGNLQKYRMTALYMNRDNLGTFTGKMRVIGDYTRGFGDGSVTWNNVFISAANGISDPFPQGDRQEYMENFRYIPSDRMVEKDAFRDFPATIANVFSRNLIWDMLTFDTYAWNFSGKLKLNELYPVSDAAFEFDIAEIGHYKHNRILVCWKGISAIDGRICAVIDFNAVDNLLDLKMQGIESKGTEQYWGTVWVSTESGEIEKGIMFSGTNQEIEVEGMNNKLLMNTIRELTVEKIK